MRVRGMIGSVLVVGAAMLAGACGPTDEPQPREGRVTQQADAAAGMACGGIANLPCPDGYECLDAPADGCNPDRNDADCGGVCVAVQQSPLTSCGNEPGYHYVLRDPAACRGVLFKCPGGSTAFFNDCGCGCKPAP